jgi:hypothetical protein
MFGQLFVNQVVKLFMQVQTTCCCTGMSDDDDMTLDKEDSIFGGSGDLQATLSEASGHLQRFCTIVTQ